MKYLSLSLKQIKHKQSYVFCLLFIIFCSLLTTACDNSLMERVFGLTTTTFVTNGGSYIEDQTLLRGERASRPKSPTQDGFYFSGWFEDDGTFQNQWDFDTPPNRNLRLYARWINTNHFVEMVLVSGGAFFLGDDLIGDMHDHVMPVTNVRLSNFYIGKYPVTQEEFYAVMNENPSSFRGNPAPGERQGRRPVDSVTWYDAIEFANRLSILTGLHPAYTMQTAEDSNIWSTDPNTWGSPNGFDGRWNAVRMVAGSDGYRLPTEAQWEFAAKGGTSSDNFRFSGSNNPNEVAWHSGNSVNNGRRITREVGRLQPNGLGIYDMSGNVWEWVWDWYEAYPGSFILGIDEHTGPLTGSERVVRGGSFYNHYDRARSVYRGREWRPHFVRNGIGFRVARPHLPQPHP